MVQWGCEHPREIRRQSKISRLPAFYRRGLGRMAGQAIRLPQTRVLFMYIMNSPDRVPQGVLDFISRIPAHTSEQFGSSILQLMILAVRSNIVFFNTLFWPVVQAEGNSPRELQLNGCLREAARRLGGIMKLTYMCPKT